MNDTYWKPIMTSCNTTTITDYLDYVTWENTNVYGFIMQSYMSVVSV